MRIAICKKAEETQSNQGVAKISQKAQSHNSDAFAPGNDFLLHYPQDVYRSVSHEASVTTIAMMKFSAKPSRAIRAIVMRPVA